MQGYLPKEEDIRVSLFRSGLILDRHFFLSAWLCAILAYILLISMSLWHSVIPEFSRYKQEFNVDKD